jgi:hypothetical protein
MKDEDVKIGMKVVPFKKTAGIYDLNTSPVWYGKGYDQGFLYVVGKHNGLWFLNSDNKIVRNYFNASDFEPFIESKAKVKRENKVKKFNPNNKTISPEFKIKRVFYNADKRKVTVWWLDDSRTTVTCAERDQFSLEEGFRAPLAKKVYGDYENYSRFIDKAIDSEKYN